RLRGRALRRGHGRLDPGCARGHHRPGAQHLGVMSTRLRGRVADALRGEDGTATVEVAFGIASIVVVVLLVLTGVAACFSQLQLEAAVRESARVAAVEGVDAGHAAG